MQALKAAIIGYILSFFQPASVEDIFKDFQKKADKLDKLAQRKMIEADDLAEQAQELSHASTNAGNEAVKAQDSAEMIRSLFPVS